jgi:tetratricopeptide (TPR) repeat protein
VALAATGKLTEARAELAELSAQAAKIPANAAVDANTPTRDIVAVAAAVLEAAILQKQGDPKAIEAWTAAVAAEDKLGYSEPDDWFTPTRHYLGQALLAASRFSEAEAVYRADLGKHPNNGWALFGLAKALRGEHRATQAAAVEREFARAWAAADIELTATALL